MNMVDANNGLRQTKKRSLRLKGVFCLVAGLVFLAEAALPWNNNMTVFILLLLEFAYVFLFQKKEIGKEPVTPARKVFRYLGNFALYLIGFALLLGMWVFIWRATALPLPFLGALLFFAIGLVLIGWSFLDFPRRVALE